ncbi:MAG: hypothetical protein DHS20C02_15170 [Micavibrio sp.]|nr:MAG: hypothetical protein DHS20C02_15170 [Micavibrio sp.]
MLKLLGRGMSPPISTTPTPSAPAFSPSDIASFEAGWETGANGSTAKTESGGDLSQWDDMSGNANHAVQTVGTSKPHYVSTPDEDLIVFNDDFLTVSSLSITGDMTVLLVARRINGGPGNQYAFQLGADLGGIFWETSSSSGKWGFYTNSGPISSTATLADGRSYNLAFKQDGANGYIYEDGTQRGTATPSTDINNLFKIGQDNGLEFYGAIRAVYVFSSALSDGDRGDMDAYIAAKWPNKTEEVVQLGDSIMAFSTASGTPTIMADYINSVSLATNGHTIQNQLGAWNGYADQADADAVIIQVGYNNCRNIGESAATAITAYQALVDQIRTDVGASVPIVVSLMTPAKQGLITELGATDGATAFVKFEALNDAIQGLGATPITDVDGVVTGHYAALDDGTDNLKTVYDSGDDVHTNALGRLVNGTYLRQGLNTALGV